LVGIPIILIELSLKPKQTN